MARKQKKLTRKQRSQQQHEVVAHQRQTKGWISPNEKARQQQELAEDMVPLLATIKPGTEQEKTKELLWLLLDTADLAEEPEFEDVILPPLEVATTFAEVGIEMGIDPEEMTDLPEDEREDQHLEIMETTTRRLLTEEVRQEIMAALDKLRRRLKGAGRPAEAGKAAALQSFLSDRKTRDLWPAVGLTQELVRRSLVIGMELMATSFEAEELEELEELAEDESSETLIQRLTRSSLGQKIGGMLQKTPGLGKFFEKEVDKAWDEGMTALYEGDLYLELFTLDEIGAGLNIFKTVVGTDTTDEADDSDQVEPQLSKENGLTVISQIDTYLTEQLTPERMDELRARLQAVLHGGDYPPKYTAFIYMVTEHLADPEAVKYEKPFLMHAFFGEMRAAAASIEEAEVEEE